MKISSNLHSLKKETMCNSLTTQKLLLLSLSLLILTTLAITTRKWMQAKTSSGVQLMVTRRSYSFAFCLTLLSCIALIILLRRDKIKVDNVSLNDVCSPMPGKCTVFVKEGENVLKGKLLFEVEAMKMVCAYHASKEGKIVKIYHRSNENVEEKVPILQIAEVRTP